MRAGLGQFLRTMPGPVTLVVHGLDLTEVATEVGSLDVVVRRPWDAVGDPLGVVPANHAVVLAVRDRVHLRRAASALAEQGRCRVVACWVRAPAGRALGLAPRPDWPVLTSSSSSCGADARLTLTFAAPVQAGDVLQEVARLSIVDTTPRGGGHVIVSTGEEPWLWPPGDPRARALAEPASLEDNDLPPDLVVTSDRAFDERALPTSQVAASATSVRHTRRPPSWPECAHDPSLLMGGEPGDLGPLDEQVVNPGGFVRTWTAPPAPLLPVAGQPALLSVRIGDREHAIDSRFGVGDADVQALRALASVHVPWRGGVGPHEYARVVVALAMAGVPLSTSAVPRWARGLIAPEVLDGVGPAVDLSSAVAREAASITVRRAALRAHSDAAWRTWALGSAPSPPQVSVVLATRRPEMVAFAVEQVLAQADVAIELVLVTHGFDLDPRVVDAVARRLSTVVVPAPEHLAFGEVLNLGVAHASGDLVLKMDDDDWYGPSFVSDLVLARAYSGAELVGCPAEFVYVEPLDVTIRRPDRTELHGAFVAGGTIMMQRHELAALGGFRRFRRSVDAGLLASVRRSGGSAYRTHGFNYLLHRGGQGHTWDPGLAYFLTSSRVSEQWHGFRPPPGVDVAWRGRTVAKQLSGTGVS